MKINVTADKDTSPKKQVFTAQLDADNWVKTQREQDRIVMREEGKLVYFSGRTEEEIIDYYISHADPKFPKKLIEVKAKAKILVKAENFNLGLSEDFLKRLENVKNKHDFYGNLSEEISNVIIENGSKVSIQELQKAAEELLENWDSSPNSKY